MGGVANRLSGIRFLPETADEALLSHPLRDISDIEAIEQTPLEDRLRISDFYLRVQIALQAHDQETKAISFIADGNVDGVVEEASFGTLREKVDRVAALLRSHAIQRDDVVAIILPTLPATYWAILGAMATAIPFPINWMLETKPLISLIAESGAKAIIALGPTPGFKIWESLLEGLGELAPGLPIWSVRGPGGEEQPGDLDKALNSVLPCNTARERRQNPRRAQDIAAYLHSGGTTGSPKIVRLTHRNLSYRHWAQQLVMQVEFGEIMLQDTPIFHVGGLAGRSLPMLASGARFVIPSIMGARDKRYISNYWRFVERFRLTRLSGVPTMFSIIAKNPPGDIDLSSLRPFFQTGSSALPPSVQRDFETVSGCRILNSYGLTENTATVAVDLRDGERRQGSSGVRVPYTHVRIVAQDGGRRRICGANEIGMIEVDGPAVTPGYLDASKAANSRSDDGWLITGDLGRLDEAGRLYVTGRAKDIIIRGGHNIEPAPIEDAVLRSPDVIYAAAVGKPDAYAGELPVAYVQLAPGSTLDEAQLIALAANSIEERAAIPKQILVVDRLPLTALQKPDKVALRMDAARRAFTDALGSVGLGRGKLGVSVESHTSRGTVVKLAVRNVLASERERLVDDIRGVMESYAFNYDIVWPDEAQ